MPKQETKTTKRRPFPWVGIAVTTAILTAICFLYWWIDGLYGETETKEIYRKLCDGFFAAGASGIGIGLLIWVSNEGGFNGISYAVQKILSRFIHSMKVATMSYGEYLDEKSDKRYRFAYVLLIGALFLLVAAVFCALFYQTA